MAFLQYDPLKKKKKCICICIDIFLYTVCIYVYVLYLFNIFRDSASCLIAPSWFKMIMMATRVSRRFVMRVACGVCFPRGKPLNYAPGCLLIRGTLLSNLMRPASEYQLFLGIVSVAEAHWNKFCSPNVQMRRNFDY